MDQKKTLWIIVAVGAFLLAVLGAALILYSPEKKQAALASTRVEKPADSYSNGWTSTLDFSSPANQQIPLPPQTQGGNTGFTTEAQEMIVFSDNTTVLGLSDNNAPSSTTIDLNSLKNESALDQYAQQQAQYNQPVPQNINITVNIPETSVNLNQTEQKVITNDYYVNNSVKENKRPAYTYEEPKEVAQTQPKTQKKAEAPAKAKTASTTSTTTSTSTTKTTKATTTVTTTVSTKAVTQYWVQVAAYSNKKGAETARSVLDENKIPADVFTYEDNKGRLFYRVRVGPYTTKSEAEYWKSKIIKISEFTKAESFVTSTTN